MSNATKGPKTLSEAERKCIKHMFDKIDSDKAGTLDIKKIAVVAKSVGCEMSQENAKDALAAFDCADGTPITFEKFTAWFSNDTVFEFSLVDEMDGVWLTAMRALMIKSMPKERKKSVPRVGTMAEVKVVKDIFAKLDSNKVGTLDVKKLAVVARYAKCEMSQANAVSALAALDCRTDPVITYEKFSDWFFCDAVNDGAWLAAIRSIMMKAHETRTTTPSTKPLEVETKRDSDAGAPPKLDVMPPEEDAKFSLGGAGRNRRQGLLDEESTLKDISRARSPCPWLDDDEEIATPSKALAIEFSLETKPVESSFPKFGRNASAIQFPVEAKPVDGSPKHGRKAEADPIPVEAKPVESSSPKYGRNASTTHIPVEAKSVDGSPKHGRRATSGNALLGINLSPT